MAEKVIKKTRGGRKHESKTALPYSRINYQLFGFAMLVILVGYWTLAQGPVDGFLSLSLAPILLVIGYCVLIPLAILYKSKSNDNIQQKHHNGAVV